MTAIIKGSDHFPEFIDAVNEKVYVGIRKAAFDVEREAVSHHTYHDRTHGLTNSIATETRKTPGGVEAYVYADMNYALYQEQGTRYITPKHYLRNALNSVVGRITEIIKGS